jgi:hypothetical protein
MNFTEGRFSLMMNCKYFGKNTNPKGSYVYRARGSKEHTTPLGSHKKVEVCFL